MSAHEGRPGGSAPAPSRRSGIPEGAGWRREHIWLLLVLTVVAGLLRLYRLGDWSFWIDEAHTLRDALAPRGWFADTSVARYPLSYMLLRGLLPVLPSDDEAWLRLPFAFFGIASVPLLGVALRPILGVGPALIAAALLSLSPWHIYWSQNCRFYSMVLFLGLVAAALFYLSLEWDSLAAALLSLASAALAALTHPSAALLFPVFLLYLVCLRWSPVKPPGWRRGYVLPLLAVMGLAGAWALLHLGPSIETYFQRKPDFSLGHLAQTTAWYVGVPVIVTAAAGAVWLLHGRSRAGIYLALLVVVPFLELVLFSTRVRATAQYLFYTLPAFCALAGVGAFVVTQRIQRGGWGSWMVRSLPLAIILLHMASYNYLYYFRTYGDRPRWREAAFFVRERMGERDMLLTSNGPSMKYYLEPGYRVVGSAGSGLVEEITPWDLHAEPLGQLERFVERPQEGSVWIVLTEPEFMEMDVHSRWAQYVRDYWRLVRTFRNWSGPKDMIVHVYRRDPPAGGS